MSAVEFGAFEMRSVVREYVDAVKGTPAMEEGVVTVNLIDYEKRKHIIYLE